MHRDEGGLPPLEIVAHVCFVMLIVSLPWTIAPMSISAVLCTALSLPLWLRVPTPQREVTPVAWPALMWMGALALSAVLAIDPGGSFPRLSKALLPALVILASFHTSNHRRGERAVTLLLFSSAAAAVFGVVSYLGRGAGFAARARGPVGHYMTFAGQLLLLVSLAAGIALTCRRGSWRWSAGLTAAIGSVALAFTYTRSAWLGLSAALLVIAGVARRRWIPAVAGLLLAVYFFAPGEFRARLHSSFEPRHATNVERTLMWKAGWRMFRERPWTGVGLQDLRAIYPRYREPQAREVPGHLHSDFVQIAATMGLVGLAAFVLLYGSLFVAAGADLPRALPERGLAAGIQLGVVAGLVGFLVAGCFEWNFGDEELLDLLYVLVGLAFATRRWPASAGAERLGQTRVEVEHAHAEPADPERAASAPSHARDT